jgi:hypothetical protein
MLEDLIGQVLDNDGVELRRALEVYLNISHFRHRGNFVFEAMLPEGKFVTVSTVPMDDEYERIQVTSITVAQQNNPDITTI